MDWIILALAGFLGGMLNAIAGGGSFITLPALVYVGVPPVLANATGTAALLPGYITSAWRFREDIEPPENMSLLSLSLMAILGGCTGSAVLLLTSEQLFSKLIPWLILLATVAFVAGPWYLERKKAFLAESQKDLTTSKMASLRDHVLLFVVCLYGGYFNGGLGIILLAAFGLMGQTNLHGMNGLKNIISALLTIVAVVVYAFGGIIDAKYLILLGSMAVLGGYTGAAFAYRINQHTLRMFIVMTGLLMSFVFFLR